MLPGVQLSTVFPRPFKLGGFDDIESRCNPAAARHAASLILRYRYSMPRTARSIEAGVIYHVLNRGNGRMSLFHKDADFAAFENVLGEGLRRYPVDLLIYCLMGNNRLTLAAWPVDRPRNWSALLDDPLDGSAAGMIRTSVARGRPLGDARWTRQIADRLGLGFTLRNAGRPRKNGGNQ